MLATNGTESVQIRGNVIGGQQPVASSDIKLYAAGTAGNGSASRPMLLSGTTPITVTTDQNGNFSITGDYACSNLEDQVYIVAQGGNPGLTAGTNNAALTLMTALGRCGDLPTTQFITVNELTTVAAAWALTPFLKDAADLGATATNTAGIRNGFLNSRLLVDPGTGFDATATANLKVETRKLNTLADALASCVNSDGTSGCSTLFAAATPPSGTAPANTLAAVLNIVRNPSNKVTDVFNTVGTVPPFGPTLTKAPSDWTMSLTVSGGGVSLPTGLALDAEGNVWVASYNGVLSAFTPQGAPMSSTGYGVGTLSESYGLVVDTNDDIWVTIEEQPHHTPTRGSMVKFHGVKTGATAGNTIGGFAPDSTGNYVFYDGSVDYPVALSADTNGNIFMDNSANASVTVFSNTGAALLDGLGSGASAQPLAIAVDTAHGVWLANQGDQSVTHVDASGNVLAHPTNCCNGANGLALDGFGNAWVANYYGSTISEVGPTGTVPIALQAGGGLNTPGNIVIDAAQDIWVDNYRGTSFSHLAGNSSTLAPGTGISGSKGYGQDAGLMLPFGIGFDPTGNIWLSNFGGTTITMFFGAATPTRTPVVPAPVAP